MAEYVTSQMALAACLGVSVSTVHGWIFEKGMPAKKTAKGYDVEAARTWATLNVRGRNSRRKASDEAHPDDTKDDDTVHDLKQSLLEEQVRNQRETADGKRLKNEIARGLWVSLEEVKRRDLERIAVVRGGLLALPRRLAQEIAGIQDTNQVEARIAQRVRELLERFSKM